ncbi:MAG: arginine--tRNA ligase [Acidimicrobiales bacterium]|nr:arginine--tRNA ligase [Acidimicrobiales bacterium]
MIQDALRSAIASALASLGIDPPAAIALERPARKEHGDWSTNVALASAKAAKRNPRELAGQLVAALEAADVPHVSGLEVAGPGFVNFHLAPTWLHEVLRAVVVAGEHGYARPDLGAGKRVNVEFVSANPTGPLHAGGGRWAAYGDALVNLLNHCGYRADREYYLNDRGVQMTLFGRSLAALKAGRPVPEDGYKGQYLEEWAAEMPDDADPVEWGYERVKRDLRETLDAAGVHFDTWFSERSLVSDGAIEATLADLAAHDATYEADGAVWLRSTDHGDDKDRVLVKSDGEPTYLLPDIAYHRNKFERGYAQLIDIWGADHHGYVARLKAGVQALGHDSSEVELILGQLVTLKRGGEEVKLSKRAGTIVTLSEVVEETGIDATRFTFLLQSLDTRQTVDLAVMASRAMENPVFYVQYAHARIAALTRQAAVNGVHRAPLEQVDLAALTHERELDLLRILHELPDIITIACNERAPHKITTWVRELAGAFHGFYHDCRIMGTDTDGNPVSDATTQARLWLVESARIGLVIGLGILGVSAPESM